MNVLYPITYHVATPSFCTVIDFDVNGATPLAVNVNSAYPLSNPSKSVIIFTVAGNPDRPTAVTV